MTAPDPGVAAALDALVERCIAQGPLWTDHDQDWPSPCELGEPDAAGRIAWRPVRRDAFDVLDPLAEVLGKALHPSLYTYFGRYFFDGFDLVDDRGPVALIGVWSAEDEQRLLQNQLGHALQQRRQRARDSLFFACTDADSELILTVANDSGEVLLERPGSGRCETIAPNLAAFLTALQPVSS